DREAQRNTKQQNHGKIMSYGKDYLGGYFGGGSTNVTSTGYMAGQQARAREEAGRARREEGDPQGASGARGSSSSIMGNSLSSYSSGEADAKKVIWWGSVALFLFVLLIFTAVTNAPNADSDSDLRDYANWRQPYKVVAYFYHHTTVTPFKWYSAIEPT